jgi:pimeloyl-ACP methyl ester carboxylesterase
MNGTWTQVAIAGKRADVYEPAGRPRFGVLYLHGAGLETLRDQPVFTSLLDQHGLACVCPHGQLCWWADRVCPAFDPVVTPERFLLDRVLPYFRERFHLAPPALGVLGISMGGQGALRLAFKHPRLFPVAAAISPALDYHEVYGEGTSLEAMYDSKEQCRQDTALMHIPRSQPPPHLFFCIDPDDVRWYRGNDRLHEKLTALGVPHTLDLTTRAGGHSWDYFNHMAGRAVSFLVAGLEHESRRLL